MTCNRLVNGNGEVVGFICTVSHPEPVHLMRGVWMTFDEWRGPLFSKDKDQTRIIEDWYDKPKIVKAFDEWMESRK